MSLKNVDLSGLTDVVLVDDNGTPIDHKNPTSPYYRLPEINRDLLDEEIGIGGSPDIDVGWYLKLCRKPYLPLKPKGKEVENAQKLLPVTSSTNPTYDNTEEVNYTGNPPQEIEFKMDAGLKGSRVGWLWYVNRLDFAIIEGFGDSYKDNPNFDPFRKRSFFDERGES